jgi:hypothetical protein
MPTADELLKQIQARKENETPEDIRKKTRIKPGDEYIPSDEPIKFSKLSPIQAEKLFRQNKLYDSRTGEANYTSTPETDIWFTMAKSNQVLSATGKVVGQTGQALFRGIHNLISTGAGTEQLVEKSLGKLLDKYIPDNAPEKKSTQYPEWYKTLLGKPKDLEKPKTEEEELYGDNLADIGESIVGFIWSGSKLPIDTTNFTPEQIDAIENEVAMESAFILAGGPVGKGVGKTIKFVYRGGKNAIGGTYRVFSTHADKLSSRAFGILQTGINNSMNTMEKGMLKFYGSYKRWVNTIDEDAAAKIGQAQEVLDSGTKYVSDLLNFDSQVNIISQGVFKNEPVNKFNKIAWGIVTAPMRFVNPSKFANSPLAKGIVAYNRQLIAIEGFVNNIKTKIIAQHGKTFRTSNLKEILPIDKDGFFGNTKAIWMDVFENPLKFKKHLTEQQIAVMFAYQKVMMEAKELLQKHAIAFGEDTIDVMYIPRKVLASKKYGEEWIFTKPTDFLDSRYYESATDGFAAGIRYLNDPSMVLDEYLSNIYKKVVDKQFNNYISKYAITPLVLIKKYAIKEFDNLKAAKDTFNKAQEGYSTYLKSGKKKQIDTGIGEIDPEDFKLFKATAKKIRDDAKKDLDIAKARYNAAKNKILQTKKTDANLFQHLNNRNGPIAISKWRNKFFADIDLKHLQGYFTKTSGEFKQGLTRRGPASFEFKGKTISPLKYLARLMDIRKMSVAGLDMGTALIQGALLLADNPKLWAKSTVSMFANTADPTFFPKLLSAKFNTVQDMAKHGLSAGDIDFFSITQKTDFSTGTKSKLVELIEHHKSLEKVTNNFVNPVFKNTFGRAQAAYTGFLGTARILMWEALLPTWRGSKDELAAYIRNMTGNLDPRGLGIGPNQRALESMALAFSPRLLRSTSAVMYDAVRGFINLNKDMGTYAADTVLNNFRKNPKLFVQTLTARQEASMNSVGKLVFSASAIWYAVGLAMGKDERELEEAQDPNNGKRYLAYEHNGQWVGFGGQVRAIIQLAARIAAGPMHSLKTIGNDIIDNADNPSEIDPKMWAEETFKWMEQDWGNWNDNPLFEFWLSRGAAGMDIFGTTIEGMSMGSINAMRYENIDNPIDAIQHLGEANLPFAIQGWLEGEHATSTAWGFVGGRSSVGNVFDDLKLIRQQVMDDLGFNQSYDTLDLDQRIVIDDDPRVIAATDYVNQFRAAEDGKINEYLTARTKATEERQNQIAKLDTWLKRRTDDEGNYWDAEDYRKERSQAYGDWVNEITALDNTFEDQVKILSVDRYDKEQTSFNIIFKEYVDLVFKPDFHNPDTEEFDYDLRDEIIQEFTDKYGQGIMDKIETVLDQNKSPTEMELGQDQETLRPYFELTENFFKKYGEKAGITIQEYRDFSSFDEAKEDIRTIYDTEKILLLQAVTEIINDLKLAMRQNNQEIDYLLNKWDYLDKSQTPYSYGKEIEAAKESENPTIDKQNIRIE